MGDQLGVFSDDEVQGLSDQEREQQKRRILQLLETNPDIRAIIAEDPRILTRNSHINAILRRELRRPGP
jgi:hypothetical protein